MSGSFLAVPAAVAVFTSTPSNPVTLGPLVFQDYEVPERIPFGGQQRLVTHKLPGGDRITDAMGRDDAPIAWSGYFSGPGAMDRARQLDALRVAGDVLPLTWGGLYYSVQIESATLDYKYGSWIPYHISCCILRDEAAAQQQQENNPTPTDDVNSAASLTPSGDGSTTVSQETVGAPGVLKTQKFGGPSDPFAQGVSLSDTQPTPVSTSELNNAKWAAATPSANVATAQSSMATAVDGGFQPQTSGYQIATGDLNNAKWSVASGGESADAGLQAINDGAPANGLVSGPTALNSATDAAGQSAQYNAASGYLNRASNTMEPPPTASTVIRPNVLDAPDAPRPGTF